MHKHSGAPASRAFHALTSLFALACAAPLASAQLLDGWSDEITWRVGPEGPGSFYATAWHATLLPNGQMLFAGATRETEAPGACAPITWIQAPDPLSVPLPAQVYVTEEQIPVDHPWGDGPDPYQQSRGENCIWDAFRCTGHAFLPDGTLFSSGGRRDLLDADCEIRTEGGGIPYAITYDYRTGNWARLAADMQGEGAQGTTRRWYPTNTTLADGRILVTSGLELIQPAVRNRSVEVFDGDTQSWTVLSSHDDAPEDIYNPDYTHAFVLPDPVDYYDVIMFGLTGRPVLFSSADNAPDRWSVGEERRPGAGYGHGVSSLMLPIRLEEGDWGYANGSVLLAGGSHGSVNERQADIFDLQERTWRSIDFGVLRHHPSTILLPDGRVLILAGHNNEGQFTGFAQYLDPANDFALTRGSAEIPEVRGYHTVSLLMPDGRVLVGGGNPTGTACEERANYRYYEPDYLTKPRPRLLWASRDELSYGQRLRIVAAPVPVDAVLVSLGSMTHSIDMTQRHVQVSLECAGGPRDGCVATMPAGPRIAPPGYYMLFVLDEDRVPSQGRILRLSANDTAK